MLSPVAVTLSPDEFEFVAENAEEFFRLGFDFEEFGNNAILVRQTPVNIGEDGIKALILELIQNASKHCCYARQGRGNNRNNLLQSGG